MQTIVGRLLGSARVNRPDEGSPLMTRLETERLTLISLSLQQMRWLRDNYARLEQTLGLPVSGQSLDDELRPIVSRAIGQMKRAPQQAPQ